MGDQILSSLTNFALGILVARSVSPHDFGAFSLAYAVYTLALGGTRAVISEPLVVRFSATTEDRWRGGVGEATGTAIAMGLIVTSICLVVAWLTQGSLAIAFLVLGAFAPPLLVQDALRFSFFAAGRGGAAFVNDLVWGVALFSLLGLLLATGATSVGWLIGIWAGSGSIAAVFGLAQARTLPRGGGAAVRWLRVHRDLVPRFAGEFAISSATRQLAVFAIGAVTGLAQLGQLRAGQVALGPLNVLFSAAGLVAVPEGVKLLHIAPLKLKRASQAVSAVLALMALGWGLLIFALPQGFGEALLGANWEGARSVVVPLSIGSAGFGAVFGAMSGLRSLAAARRSLQARYVDGFLTLSAPIAGALLAGGAGAAWGYAIAGVLRIPNWWRHFSRAFNEHQSTAGQAGGGAVKAVG